MLNEKIGENVMGDGEGSKNISLKI